MIHKVADDLWIVDGPIVRFLGLNFPTRMTIVHLDDRLWVHSPVPITPEIATFISAHGDAAYVVAPNDLHHLYLMEWQSRYPEACYVAAPGLRSKRSDLRFDDDLLPDSVHPWSEQIGHAHFLGNRHLEEVVFFHQASKTLILTDLIINVKIDEFGWLQKLFAKFDGLAYPDDGTPRLFRWSMRRPELAKRCYEQMLDWAPDKMIISHGECFLTNATEEVKRRFGWVTS